MDSALIGRGWWSGKCDVFLAASPFLHDGIGPSSGLQGSVVGRSETGVPMQILPGMCSVPHLSKVLTLVGSHTQFWI